jgi:O-antigen/teichoic acid export membrane protein
MNETQAPGAARILRNTAWTVGSELAARALGFLAVVYLASRLGTDGFGKLGFAQAVLVYFSLFSEFGIRVLGTRTLARERERVRERVAPFLWARLLLLAAGAVALAALWLVLPKPPVVKQLIVLYWLSLVPAAFFLDWVYWALERMALPALASLLRAALYLGLLLALVRGPGDLLDVAGANLAAAIAVSLALGAAFVWRQGWPRPRLGEPLRLIAQAVPIGIGAVMVQIYYNLDTVCLGLMRTDAEVGQYTAAYKIVLVAYALGGAFPQMVFPALAKAFHEDESRARQLFGFALRLTLAAAFPVALGGVLLSGDLLGWVYSADFGPAAPAFRILLATLFFMLAGNLYGSTVLACDRQRRYVAVVTAGAALNTVLNLLAIPRYGMLGAAGATLATEVVVFAGMNASLPEGLRGRLAEAAWRPALATLLMGVLVLALRPVSPVLALVAAVPAYLGLAFALGALRREDLGRLARP